ncbi:YesL family protein [Propionibacteriaceae bacterium Y2011]
MSGGTLGRPLAVLDTILQWIIRLVWLNLWWVALTLLGGVVLGFGPATVAAHTVATRWLKGETDLSVPHAMWQEWRRNWGRRVLVSVLCIGLTVSLAITWLSAREQTAISGAVIEALSTVGLLLAAATLSQVTWVTERTDLTVGRTLVAALAAAISRPFLTGTLLLLGLGWPTLLIVTGWPGLLPACGVSVPLLAGAWCIERAFPSPLHTNDDSPAAEVPTSPPLTPLERTD